MALVWVDETPSCWGHYRDSEVEDQGLSLGVVFDTRDRQRHEQAYEAELCYELDWRKRKREYFATYGAAQQWLLAEIVAWKLQGGSA